MEALVYGGAASGKSRYAEDLLCALSGEGPRIYLATMEAMDEESRARVRRHRALRQNKGFSTLECPRDLDGLTIPVGSSVLLEDLGNLIKNGRLNKATGLVASILAMCPIMSDDGNGEIKLAQKVRGLKNAMSKLTDLVVEQAAGSVEKTVTLVISYCNCPERAGTLKLELLAKCAALKEVVLVPTGGLSTVYANNGGIVLAF